MFVLCSGLGMHATWNSLALAVVNKRIAHLTCFRLMYWSDNTMFRFVVTVLDLSYICACRSNKLFQVLCQCQERSTWCTHHTTIMTNIHMSRSVWRHTLYMDMRTDTTNLAAALSVILYITHQKWWLLNSWWNWTHRPDCLWSMKFYVSKISSSALAEPCRRVTSLSLIHI